MRSVLGDKLGEDHLVTIKNKEKSVALFNEVVRIGQDLDKHASQLQQHLVATESKFQTFETKILKAEQESANADHLGNMVSNMLATLTDKSEGRLNQLENNVELLIVFLPHRDNNIE